MPWYEVLAIIVAATLMLTGLTGSMLPVVPGIHLVWIGFFLYSVVTKFQVIPVNMLGFTAALVFLTYFFEYRLHKLGAKSFRITMLGVLSAVLGAFVGSLFDLFPGLVLGALIGGMAGTLIEGRDSTYTIETRDYQYVGYLGNAVLKVLVSLLIIGLWVRAVFL